MTFTTTSLRQMNLRPLAGLSRIEKDCMMNGGSGVGHIGIEVSGTLLFLSVLSCGAVPSLFVLLCSRAKPLTWKQSAATIPIAALAPGSPHHADECQHDHYDDDGQYQ